MTPPYDMVEAWPVKGDGAGAPTEVLLEDMVEFESSGRVAIPLKLAQSRYPSASTPVSTLVHWWPRRMRNTYVDDLLASM